jgi:hypothetical protein
MIRVGFLIDLIAAVLVTGYVYGYARYLLGG